MTKQQSLPNWFPEEESTSKVPKKNKPTVLSVSALNRQIKANIESEFPMVFLQGEVSNFTSHSSGHFYFSLKDSKSQISAVMFRGQNSGLRFKPEMGMEVIVRARVSVYEPRGNYQVICETMEPVGAGALQKEFEQLKIKLQKEGLFDKAHKKPLPGYPKKIALVTSPTGAAVRDMLNVLSRRYKALDIYVVPCQVQGGTASREIIKAIQLVNSFSDFDVMIVGRGGGSMEDLWSFNDEALARCIFASNIPIVSAVGHEIDFTIADFVADLRAPTPSAAAELIVKDAKGLQQSLNKLLARLKQSQKMILNQYKHRLQSLGRVLVDPQKELQQKMQRLDEIHLRLSRAIDQYLFNKGQSIQLLRKSIISPKQLLESKAQYLKGQKKLLDQCILQYISRSKYHLVELGRLLDSVSPLAVLERGYSIVKKQGNVLKSVDSLKKGDKIEVTLFKGNIHAKVESLSKE